MLILNPFHPWLALCRSVLRVWLKTVHDRRYRICVSVSAMPDHATVNQGFEILRVVSLVQAGVTGFCQDGAKLT